MIMMRKCLFVERGISFVSGLRCVQGSEAVCWHLVMQMLAEQSGAFGSVCLLSSGDMQGHGIYLFQTSRRLDRRMVGRTEKTDLREGSQRDDVCAT